ncbi:MAG: HlyC/CorC family transporter [Lachnospiraceae bacterium]|nr:HlyC/CorC family transporter [Lachnospiraceae bacterium]
MENDGTSGSLVLFLVMLLSNMFFYGVGEAIRSLNLKEVERKAEEKDKKSLKLKRLIDNPARYVNSMQVIVSAMNIVGGMLVLLTWRQWIGNKLQVVSDISPELVGGISTVIAAFVLLYILLTFGILLPKQLANTSPEKWAYACIEPAYAIVVLTSPLTGLVTVTVKGILRLLGKRETGLQSDVTEESIIDMVNEGHEQGVILASEAEMISNIFEFGDKEAQDIMTHRNNITAIDGNVTLQDALGIMLEGKNSRYPVYEENIDHIIGILHLKDAMRTHVDEEKKLVPIRELEGLLREPYFVPQTKNIDELFKEMQAGKLQMVIVLDEYGQTDGLVAMEDILEEIVGNIQDEYDEDGEYIEEKGNDEYIIEGKTPLEELEERFGITFVVEDFETLNGFLISKLDRIPEPDEQFDVDYEGYNFKILSVENKMIQSVLVTKLPQSALEEIAN